MKARVQTAIDQLTRAIAGDTTALAELQVTLGQALEEATDPPAPAPIDAQLAAIDDKLSRLVDAAGV